MLSFGEFCFLAPFIETKGWLQRLTREVWLELLTSKYLSVIVSSSVPHQQSSSSAMSMSSQQSVVNSQ